MLTMIPKDWDSGNHMPGRFGKAKPSTLKLMSKTPKAGARKDLGTRLAEPRRSPRTGIGLTSRSLRHLQPPTTSRSTSPSSMVGSQPMGQPRIQKWVHPVQHFGEKGQWEAVVWGPRGWTQLHCVSLRDNRTRFESKFKDTPSVLVTRPWVCRVSRDTKGCILHDSSSPARDLHAIS